MEESIGRYAVGLVLAAPNCVGQMLVTFAGVRFDWAEEVCGGSGDVVAFVFRAVDGIEPATRNILPWRSAGSWCWGRGRRSVLNDIAHPVGPGRSGLGDVAQDVFAVQHLHIYYKCGFYLQILAMPAAVGRIVVKTPCFKCLWVNLTHRNLQTTDYARGRFL